MAVSEQLVPVHLPEPDGRSDSPGKGHALDEVRHQTTPEASPLPSAGDQTLGGDSDAMDLSHPLAQDLLLAPTTWNIWPAVAVLRWLLRSSRRESRHIFYRCVPSLKFSPSEILDVAIDSRGFDLFLPAPGVAAPGSPLPVADVERIIADFRRGGAIAAWLDGITDRLMQALEVSTNRSSTAFALATGGRIEMLRTIANIVGLTATITASADGVLWNNTLLREPVGAIGLAGMFVGGASASGLTSLFEAVTELPVRVEEFTGAEVSILRPAHVGGVLGGDMLGWSCRLAAAGVRIVIDGRSRPEAQELARNRTRRRSLYRLATSYIGSSSPSVQILLELGPDTAPPAALDGSTAIGGLAVLGEAGSDLRLPLAA